MEEMLVDLWSISLIIKRVAEIAVYLVIIGLAYNTVDNIHRTIGKDNRKEKSRHSFISPRLSTFSKEIWIHDSLWEKIEKILSRNSSLIINTNGSNNKHIYLILTFKWRVNGNVITVYSHQAQSEFAQTLKHYV